MPASTVTTISSSLSQAANPVVVTLAARVTSTVVPLGTVTFTDTVTNTALGTQALSALGQATITTSSLGAGQHLISVSYTPATGNFVPSISGQNRAPAVTIAGPPSGDVHSVNTAINFTATFTDPDTASPSAQWTFDSGAKTNGTVSSTAGSGAITGSYTFGAAGVYGVTLTFNDGLGGISIVNTVNSANAPTNLPASVVVYDPSAGFVTGGGWIDSPTGAYSADPSLAGKASFGFVSKYEKGAAVPTGQTEFNFQVAKFDFHSTNYQWMVVSGSMAQYKGAGTINGSGNYNFLLTALDGSLAGNGIPDGFRIKITDPNTGAVVYDSRISSDDSINAKNAQPIGGGSIVIHSGK
jgi:hypothetical protein